MSHLPDSNSSARSATGVLIGSAVSAWRFLLSGMALGSVSLGACWLLFFNELRGEWQVNPQYSFGFVVPFLGVVLLLRRWPDRPETRPARAFWPNLLAVGLLFLQLPLGLLFEANPEWRLLYWANAFQVFALTFCVLYQFGGVRWIRHFGMPLLFMLIAVPWPMNLEQTAIQGLMRIVAGLTVEVANFLSIPAVQHGNLIEVGVGLVGIDEACSGVRSLQSALMLSLFLGEINRFPALRRAGLLGASLMLVLFANLSRTTFLVWAAANRGLHQMETWHDAAGNIVMFIVLPSLIGLAWLLNPKVTQDRAASNPALKAAPNVPRWIGIAVLGWLLFVQIVTESWYRNHETALISNPSWSVAWPTENSRFRRTAVPESSLAILRCSNSDAAVWEDNGGNEWSAFLLRWNPGKNSAQLARGHRPDICFPAAGARLAENFEPITIDANGIKLSFRHQSFEAGTRSFHVFYCLWSDRQSADEDSANDDGSQASRIRAALAGKRNLGQQVFEIVLQGPESGQDAVEIFKSQLPSLIKPIGSKKRTG